MRKALEEERAKAAAKTDVEPADELELVARAEIEELMELMRLQKLAKSLSALAVLLPRSSAAASPNALQLRHLSGRVKGGENGDDASVQPQPELELESTVLAAISC